MTKSHHESISTASSTGSITTNGTPERLSNANNNKQDSFLNVLYEDRKSNFLTTSRIIRLFGAGVKAPEK